MRTILLFLFLGIIPAFSYGEVRIHPQNLGLAYRSTTSDGKIMGILKGHGVQIITKVDAETNTYEYLAKLNIENNIEEFANYQQYGLAIDYTGINYTTVDSFKTLTPNNELQFTKVFPTSTGMVALHQNGGIYFSDDAMNWTQKANGNRLKTKVDLVWGFNDVNNLIISTNGGKDWGNEIDLSAYDIVSRYVDAVNESVIIVREDSKRKLHITTDGGATWNTTETLQGNIINWYFMDAQTGFAYTNATTIYCTSDGGNNWTGLYQFFPTLPEEGTPFLWAISGNKIFLNINGKIYFTEDRGITWTFFFENIGGKFYDIDQMGNVVLIGGQNGYYALSTNSGKLFRQFSWGKEDIMAVKILNDSTYTLGDRKGQVYLLTNWGAGGRKKTTSSGNYNARHFEMSEDGNVIMLTRVGQPAVSIDAGNRFDYVNVGGGDHKQTLTPDGKIIDVVSGTISMVKATNGQKTELTTIEGINSRRISMANESTGYLITFKDTYTLGSYITRDGWNSNEAGGDITVSTIDGYLSVFHIGDGHVLMTMDDSNEVYETTDYGKTWTTTPLDFLTDYTNAAQVLKGSHFNSLNNFWVVTENGLVFMNDDNNTENPSAAKEIANRNALNIYPNPAQNLISIQTNLPLAAISIYDLNGKNVYQQTNPVNLTLSISHLKKGIYIIRTTSKQGINQFSQFIKN